MLGLFGRKDLKAVLQLTGFFDFIISWKLMIDEIKKDLRAQVEEIQKNGKSMDEWSWGSMKGVLLSGADALALLEYIESLEVTEVPFDEVHLHGTYRMNNGDIITITDFDPNEFYCFGGYVDGEYFTFTRSGAWSRWNESQYSLKTEINGMGHTNASL